MKYPIIVVLLISMSVAIFSYKNSSFNFLKNNSTDHSLDNKNSITEVKRILKDLDWIIGLSGWNRGLNVEDCSDKDCHVEIVFSSPQICPEGSADDEWCDEIEFSGTATFTSHGIELKNNKDHSIHACELFFETETSSWKFIGNKCPSSFTEVRAHENRPAPLKNTP